MRSAAAWLTLLVAGLLGCNPTDASPEKLVGATFKAIQAKDYEAYRKYMLTRADLEMAASGQQGLFKQKQGYVGGVLKPEELKQQRGDFDAATAGTLGLDFTRAQYVGLASNQPAPVDLILGPQVDGRVVTMKVRVEGKEQDVPSPAFLVIPWHNNRYRLLGMVQPGPR